MVCDNGGLVHYMDANTCVPILPSNKVCTWHFMYKNGNKRPKLVNCGQVLHPCASSIRQCISLFRNCECYSGTLYVVARPRLPASVKIDLYALPEKSIGILDSMIFEQSLGIKPSEWLRHPQIDSFMNSNRVPLLQFEASATRAVGVHVSVLRLVIALFATIPVGVMHRFVPSATGRHLYSFVTGVVLLYYPFGNQVILPFISCLSVYLVIVLIPRSAGKVSWALSFGFLLLCMERTGDLWDRGVVDITGALMVIALKQVAIAHNVSDSCTANQPLPAESRSLFLPRSPAILPYLSFMFASGNLLAGPFNEFTHYVAFTNRTGVWATAFAPGMAAPTLLSATFAVMKGILCLAANRTIETYFSPLLLTSPRVWHFSLLQRLGIAFITAVGKRCQYYFIWGISEAGMIVSGFGFNGYTDRNVPVFDRYKNASVWKVETCNSIAVVPQHWNINTGYFLRCYVYNRCGGGVAALAATQMVSGVWHGLREGHLFFFALTVPMFHSSKVIYKQEKRLPPSIINSLPWQVLKWLTAHVPLMVFCQSFITQHFALFWTTWQAFYFVPHMFVVILCFLGMLLPIPQSQKDISPHSKTS